LQQQKPHQCGWLLKAVGFPGFPATEKPGFFIGINNFMLRFKQFLIEENLQRRIFTEPPSPLASEKMDAPVYNQITQTGKQAQFDVNDPAMQSNWRQSRQQFVGSDDGAWDFTDVGKGKIEDTKAKSPSYKAGQTFKRFYSVKGIETPAVQKQVADAMGDFNERMNRLADHFGTNFSYKVPKHAKSAAEHSDTLVLHHYDLPDSSLSKSIDATTREWAKKHGIEFLDRQGTDIGVDSKEHGSFSQQLAKGVIGGQKGSLGQMGQKLVSDAVARIKNSGTQTAKNLGAAGLAAAGALTGSALTQGAQAMTDVLGMMGTLPTPKDRMEIEKSFNSDIGLGFNLSPEGELEADPQGREAVRKRNKTGINFPSMFQ
jgi:hypothetical protein